MRRPLSVLLCALSPGLLFCGSFGSNDAPSSPIPTNDAAEETNDAGSTFDGVAPSDTGPEKDALAPKTKCAFDKLFASPPKHLSTISTPSGDLGIWLTPDELEVYVGSGFDFGDAGNTGGLYRATRAKIGDQFAVPTLVFAGEVTDPVLTDDLKTVYFVRSESPGSPFYDILVASRPNAQGVFGLPTPLAVVNATSTIEIVPSIASEGDELFFASNRLVPNADARFRVFRATKNGSGFAAPTVVSELEPTLTKSVSLPVLSHDRRSIYFTIANDDIGSGKVVYRARRTNVNAPFSQVAPVSEIDGGNQYPRWLSEDECRLYIGENRPGGRGLIDLYVYERQP